MDFVKRMVDRYEQVELFSQAEYDRRRALMRQVMAEEGVDMMLVLNAPQDAFDQWIAGKRLLSEVIIPKNGDIVGVLYPEWAPELSTRHGTDAPFFGQYLYQRPFKPVCAGLAFRDSMTADELARLVASYAPKTIGLVNADTLTHVQREAFRAHLPKVEFHDITVPASLRKVVKSPEEIEAIRIANNIHERVMLAMPQVIRQGRSVFEMNNEITQMLHELGSGNTLVHHWNIMPGDQEGAHDPGAAMSHFPGYMFKRGDRVLILLESNGPGGHHVAIARHFTLGPAVENYKKIVAMAARTQAFAASQLRPGNTLREVAEKTRAFILSQDGFRTNEQNFMHGLGLNYGEPYSLNHYSENMPLPENAYLHAHPIIRTTLYDAQGQPYRYESFVLDTFLVRPEGGQRMTTLSHDIVEIEI